MLCFSLNITAEKTIYCDEGLDIYNNIMFNPAQVEGDDTVEGEDKNNYDTVVHDFEPY